MKNMMKKILCSVLIVVMCLTLEQLQGLVGVDFNFSSVSAAEGVFNFSEVESIVSNYYNRADDIDFEEYLATHYTTSPTIDLINIGMEKTPIAPGFVKDLQGNAIFQTAYAAWEISTFIGNPGETVEKLLNRELYYETVLFKLLQASVNSDNAIDWLNQGAIKHSVKFCKYLTSAAEIDFRYDVAKTASILDLSEADKAYFSSVSTAYINSQGYKTIGDGAKFVENALTMAKTIEDFSERLGSYIQLAHLSDATITFLETLKNNSDNELLSDALDTVLAVSSESFYEFMDVAAKDGATKIGVSAMKSFVGSKWKNLLLTKLSSGVLATGYSIVNGVLLANSIGQSVSNICFSTSKKLDHYELTKALVETENAIKSTVTSLLNEGTQGTIISKGIDLLYEVYELDCDLCLDLVAIMDKDWIQLSTTAERNQAKADINTVKSFYSNQYSEIIPMKGTCGDDLYWIFDSMSGELLIYGFGRMNDYSKEKAPWYIYKDSIRSLHISSLCTRVGTYAFYNLSNLKTPIILTNHTKYDVEYKEGCFDSLNNNSTIIFTEDVKLDGLNNSDNIVVYALGDIFCDGPSYFKELYVQGNLCSSNILSIAEDGILITKTFTSSNVTTDRGAHLYINKNTSVEIYGDAQILGKENNSFVDKYFDALTMQSGGSFTVYGDAHFCSGNYTINSGSQINITGDCLIGNGGISEDTFFYNYGDMNIGNKLSVEGGYCSDSVLKIYGTATMADFSTSAGAGSAVGITVLIGKMYITDETVAHDLSTLVMKDSSYLSVRGKAYYINNYRGDTYFKDIGKGPCVGTIELYNDAYFSEPAESNLTLIFNGEEMQKITASNEGIVAGTFIINNKKGVFFEDEVKSLMLFNHKQNPFTLENSKNTFQDYDNDGLLDNVDPYPLDPLDGQNNTDFVVTMANSNLTITGYTGNESHLIIPDSINGYNVTSVGYTFDGCSFESVTLGANVSNLSSTAFNNATTINAFDVSSENNTFISDNGVLYTKDTTKLIKYPKGKKGETYSMIDGVKTIESNAFYNTKIKSIVLPDTLNTISSNAFSNCKIESVRIPEEVHSIGLDAFLGCSTLKAVYYDAINCTTTSIFFTSIFPSSVENFIIGEKVEALPGYLLRNSSISEITIPANVKTINTNAFSNCNELTIKGYINSCAKEFADSNGYSFISLTCGNCVCEDWQVTTDSTCTEEGIKTGVCSTCGTIMSGLVEKRGHRYADSWSVLSAASCTEKGSEIRTCTTCNSATETRDIEALGHDFNDGWTVDNEATCIKEGSKSHHCSRCDEKSDVTVINKIAHTYKESIQEATCTENGKKTNSCSSCGDSYSEVIVAERHIDQNGDKKCDNCDYIYDNTCSHLCHKSGILGIFWKIIRFLLKLFGMNPVCECGAAHY